MPEFSFQPSSTCSRWGWTRATPVSLSLGAAERSPAQGSAVPSLPHLRLSVGRPRRRSVGKNSSPPCSSSLVLRLLGSSLLEQCSFPEPISGAGLVFPALGRSPEAWAAKSNCSITALRPEVTDSGASLSCGCHGNILASVTIIICHRLLEQIGPQPPPLSIGVADSGAGEGKPRGQGPSRIVASRMQHLRLARPQTSACLLQPAGLQFSCFPSSLEGAPSLLPGSLAGGSTKAPCTGGSRCG